MKKTTTIVCICLAILLAIGVSIYIGILKPPIDVNEVEEQVIEHIDRKGLSKEKYDITVNYNWESKLFGYNHNPYVIKVVFKDEPEVYYYYTYHYKSKLKEVTQSGIAPMNDRKDKDFKHSE